jgi:hypothetical protein
VPVLFCSQLNQIDIQSNYSVVAIAAKKAEVSASINQYTMFARRFGAQIPKSCVRFASSTSHQAKSRTFHEKSFKEAWLLDPATYPIMGIISVAVSGCVFFMFRRLFTDVDVKVSRTRRTTLMRGDPELYKLLTTVEEKYDDVF